MYRLAILVLILSGCANITSTKYGIQTDLEFNQTILKDVEQAILLAQKTNDQIALQCWEYVKVFTIEHVPSEKETGTMIGVLSTYQRVRNVRRTLIEIRISDEFRLKCGPMLMNSLGVLSKLGFRISL